MRLIKEENKNSHTCVSKCSLTCFFGRCLFAFQELPLQLSAIDLILATLSLLPAQHNGQCQTSGISMGNIHLYLVVREWGISCFEICLDRPIILLLPWSSLATAALYVGLCAVVILFR